MPIATDLRLEADAFPSAWLRGDRGSHVVGTVTVTYVAAAIYTTGQHSSNHQDTPLDLSAT